MKRVVSAYISRKWWYQWIRSLSWFSFRYYWFTWLSFILACILLLGQILLPIHGKSCKTDIINNSIKQINYSLSHCCNCSNQQDVVNNDAPQSPPNAIPCNENDTISDKGNNIVPLPKSFEVGNQSGTIKLCFDNGNTFPDNIIVKHKGQIIKQTGQVIGKDCINVPYNYHQGDPTFIEVFVEPSSEAQTLWKYTLGCPNL